MQGKKNFIQPSQKALIILEWAALRRTYMPRYTAFYIALTVGVRYEMHTDLRYRLPIGTPFFLYVYEHAMAEVNKVVAFEGHNYTFTTALNVYPSLLVGKDQTTTMDR